MFEGFTHHDVEVRRTTIHALTAGEGPPLLLLHGFPETHLMWHAVAPQLTAQHRVVLADLPGYGDSGQPRAAEDHAPHSKRAIAQDLVEMMGALGHERFAVAGHDRGGRVAYRMALDAPEIVTRLAVLDIVPTAEVWARADGHWALTYWWWPFLAQPAPQPEEMLLAAPPQTLLSHHFEMVRRGAPGYPIEIVQDYADRLANPAAVAQMCEDYRAGATIDVALDEADRAAGRRIQAPTLVLWGADAWLAGFYDDVVGIWRDWADDVRGEPIAEATHFVAQDAPEATAAALREFLGAGAAA